MAVLIETEQNMKDFYYKYLSERGLLDFVDQIIKIDEESGLFIDYENNRKITIQAKHITLENHVSLIEKIKRIKYPRLLGPARSK